MQHRSHYSIGFSLLVAASVLMAATAAKRTADVALASLDLAKMRVQAVGGGRGGAPPQNVAQANKAIDGRALHIGGKEFAQGVGTRATSVLFVNLGLGAERFTAMVGADDNAPAPPAAAAPAPAAPPPATAIVFRVLGDGRVLHVTKSLVAGDAPERVDVDVNGIKTLVLQVKPVEGNRAVAADWADAKFAVRWNSWNAFGRAVSDSLARAAADAMVSKRLIDHGWAYVNLYDGWERSAREADPLYEGPVRAPDGTMLTNKKFPDMNGHGDYVHAKGLKFGIYSGPGPTTCQRLEASWQHELQDFQTFASWGVDYLKYDWCGYSSVLATGETNTQLPVLKRPYQVARTALNQVKRDIIYSLCQYGWGNVWEWGAEPGIDGNSWRTTGDITDTWESMNGIGFRQVGNSKYASPGHWNDPDMLVIGKVGWGPRLRDSRLTANEQYIHITLWTLLASPLLLGNDLTQMDAFELNLVINDEVLGVHQDPLGKAADRVARDGEREVWSRPLSDGSLAVGLFNRDEMDMAVTVTWAQLGITGKHTVRDLWRQKDIGSFDGEFSRVVPRHGTLFVRVRR